MKNLKHLQKQYVRKGLEQQIRADFDLKDLVIESPLEAKEESKKEEKIETPKKKTSIDIHFIIKNLIKEISNFSAQSVLKQAIKNGFKNKQPDAWHREVEDFYFKTYGPAKEIVKKIKPQKKKNFTKQEESTRMQPASPKETLKKERKLKKKTKDTNKKEKK